MSKEYVMFAIFFKKSMNEDQMNLVKSKFESLELVEMVEPFTLEEMKTLANGPIGDNL